MAKRRDISDSDREAVINNAIPSNKEKVLKPYDPSASQQVPEVEPVPEPPQETVAEAEPVKEKEVPREEPKRKRSKTQNDTDDFIAFFLHETEVSARSGKTVYICKEHHDRITKILHQIGKNKVSLFSYIYNVLEHHFETYRDGITELYEKNRESIF